jgi:hypothetical protein
MERKVNQNYAVIYTSGSAKVKTIEINNGSKNEPFL